MKNALKQYKTIDEWRNCPMANFVCPVATETRLETNAPRGKMFLLSLLCNGTLSIDDDIVQRMYECCLCGLCTQCGFDDTDIPAAMAAARADICEEDRMPEKVRALGKTITDECVWNKVQGIEELITLEDAIAFITWEDATRPPLRSLLRKRALHLWSLKKAITIALCSMSLACGMPAKNVRKKLRSSLQTQKYKGRRGFAASVGSAKKEEY
jgi:hypothetical protein